MTTDERASFLILSIYMFMFCLTSFVYFDTLVLRIAGLTAATAGAFLFYAAFFNTEGGDERRKSKHPLRSYLVSFFLVLLTLFLLRLLGGLINNARIWAITLYSGLAGALILFRKALIQVVSLAAACIFIFVTAHNWERAVGGEMTFGQAVRQCGQALFRIGPIQEVSSMLIAGSYVQYLEKVDCTNDQINMLATRLVLDSGDDELRKTQALLDFVSNEIRYISDPGENLEYVKDPISTLIAGGGDCEDQALLLCSLMESVGLKTYIAFTKDHVFALVRFPHPYKNLEADPFVYLDGTPCYALDPADAHAQIGTSSARPEQVRRVFDVRSKTLAGFKLYALK